MDITVEVTDTNDNSPEFVRFIANVNVTENATVGTRIVSVKALDPDLKKFGEVRYKIISGNSDGNFNINSRVILL